MYKISQIKAPVQKIKCQDETLTNNINYTIIKRDVYYR